MNISSSFSSILIFSGFRSSELKMKMYSRHNNNTWSFGHTISKIYLKWKFDLIWNTCTNICLSLFILKPKMLSIIHYNETCLHWASFWPDFVFGMDRCLVYQGTRQIAHLIAFFPGYFVFKNENVKVKVKYGFVLQDSPFYFRVITSYLKMSGMPCLCKLN